MVRWFGGRNEEISPARMGIFAPLCTENFEMTGNAILGADPDKFEIKSGQIGPKRILA